MLNKYMKVMTIFVSIGLTACALDMDLEDSGNSNQGGGTPTPKNYETFEFSNLPVGVESDLYLVELDNEALDLLKTTPPTIEMAVNIKPGASDGAASYRASNRSFSWAQFGFDETKSPATLTITKQDTSSGDVTDILVRPTQLEGIAYEIVSEDLAAKTLTLKVLQSNRKLSVEFVDDRYATLKDLPLDALLIFADQLESQDKAPMPDLSLASTYIVQAGVALDNTQAALADTVVFEAGTHDLGLWRVPASVKHVYLAGGAYVLGSIYSAHDGKNGQSGYTVSGRGVISGEKFAWRADMRTDGATVCVDSDGFSTGCPTDGIKPINADQNDFLIEGVTLVNIPFYAFRVGYENSVAKSERKGTVSNVKMLGMWRYNNDGFDLPDNVVLEDCFVAPMDDGFKVYHDNSTVRDCVVWQMDNGGIFQFGWFPKNVDGATIENIHVIHTEWTGLNKNRGLANLTERPAGDTRSGVVKNVSFKNVYIEGPISRVIYLRNSVYPNQSYRNWRFENIHVEYMPIYDKLVTIKQEFGGNGQLNADLLPNAIEDFTDGNGDITDIKFINFNLNGSLITNDNATTDGMFQLKTDSLDSVNFAP